MIYMQGQITIFLSWTWPGLPDNGSKDNSKALNGSERQGIYLPPITL